MSSVKKQQSPAVLAGDGLKISEGNQQNLRKGRRFLGHPYFFPQEVDNLFTGNVMMWVWLAVVIICVIVELCTTALTTIWFAFSGVLMIFLSKFKIPIQWQILIFLIVAFALLFVTRPLVLKKIKAVKTNINAIEGQKVLVTEKITELEKGTVQFNGVTWNAKSSDSSIEIEKDTLCEIVEVTGSTLVVKPVIIEN